MMNGSFSISWGLCVTHTSCESTNLLPGFVYAYVVVDVDGLPFHSIDVDVVIKFWKFSCKLFFHRNEQTNSKTKGNRMEVNIKWLYELILMERTSGRRQKFFNSFVHWTINHEDFTHSRRYTGSERLGWFRWNHVRICIKQIIINLLTGIAFCVFENIILLTWMLIDTFRYVQAHRKCRRRALESRNKSNFCYCLGAFWCCFLMLLLLLLLWMFVMQKLLPINLILMGRFVRKH